MSHTTSYLSDSDSSVSVSDSSDSDSDSDSYEVPYHNNEAEEITEQQAEQEERLANSDEYMQDNDNEIESLILSKIRKRNKRKQEKRIRSIQEAYSTFTRKGQLDYNQYQFEGVQWCMDRERNKSTSQYSAYQLHKGGILGDEMGLGKTIVMLGTIYCSDYIHNRKSNTSSTPIRQTLVVVPLILLQQWSDQIEKMIGIKPLLYHGPQKFIYDVESLRSSEIILTTYHTLVYERKAKTLRVSGNITEDIYDDIDYFGANIFQEDNEEEDVEEEDVEEEDVEEDIDDDDNGDVDLAEEQEEEEDEVKEKEEDIDPDIDYFGFSMTREDDETSRTSRVTRGVKENVNEVSFSLFDNHFHRVIFDEAHHLRSMNSKVYHCVSKLNTTITWMITGTPLQNKREDVIALLKLLGYRSNFKEDEEMADILSKVFLKRTKAQVGIQIPDVKIQRVSSPWQNVHEKNLSQKLHECLEPDVLRSKGVSTRMILPVMLYSRMMCVHPQMIVKHIPALDRMGIIDRNFQEHLDIEKANSKLNSVLSLLATRISNGNRKIIFTQFHQESAYLEDKLKQMKKCNNFLESSSESESDDNDDSTVVSVGSIDGRTPKKIRDQVLQSSYDVLIIQIQTGNEGLNLQKYNEIYIVTPSWNPKLEEQAIARCHRLGQTKEVHVFKFVMEEFSSISFESPSDPVYVVDKRKRKMVNHNSRDRTQDDTGHGESDDLMAVGHKRKRQSVADFEVMEDIDVNNCDYYGLYGEEEEEDDDDDKNNENDNTNAEETDNKSLDNKNYNKLVKLNFSSQWTGTCKNIEMYSEEMQDRKNQLEIDIGISR